MSKIFLLSTNICVNPYPVYPLGMALIASALASRGHLVRQFDFLAENRSESRLYQAITSFDPNYIGVSIRNVDSVDSFTTDSGWYLAEDKRVISLVRRITDVPIIVGGSGFSLIPEEILDYTGADYGVVGEGEKVVCDLLEALESGLSVPRIIAGGTFLHMCDKMSLTPIWEKSLIEFYFQSSGIVNLQTKRGCPHKCTYCGYPNLEGRHYRFRDTKSIVADLERLKRTYRINTVVFTDSIFNDEKGHHLEVAEELLSSGVKIRWSGFFRPQKTNRKELALLKRSGLYAIEAGTDASSDRTLEGLKKGFCFNEVIEFNRMCVEESLACVHYIIFGGPGETEESLREGLENINKLKSCVVLAFSGIRIFPKTAIHALAVKEKVITENESLLWPRYYFSPHIVRKTMNELIEKAFKGHHEKIFPPSEAHIRMAAMIRFGYHGFLWDKLISFSQKRNTRKR
jgi:lipid biosynthesis B12-binding/radical SAM protein